MVESCYKHHYGAVGIVGPSAEITSSLQSHGSFSIILIDYVPRSVAKKSLDHPASRKKLQTFLISIPSGMMLKKILQDLKKSQWWNHMASFLIIYNLTSLGQVCTPFWILSTTWEMNLLHAKFLCRQKSKDLLIYSYNPYTNPPRILGQLQVSYKLHNGLPWTLLARSYQENQEICKDFNIDQTKDLGGYEIQAGVLSSNINKNSSRRNLENVTGFNSIVARYIFRALNSTTKIFDTQSTFKLLDITNRSVTDISLVAWPIQKLNFPMTYPHWRLELACITQHRGNLSQIQILHRVIDHFSRYAVVLVCFITFVFYKFFLRQSVTSAILTIVRLICNAAVPNPPNKVATRIYLSGLFIFVMTMQGIFQGKLTSLLTKPVALPNVEKFEDLENFKYTIYGSKHVTTFFENLNYSGLLAPVADFNCVEYVLRDAAAACVGDKFDLVNRANEFDLNLSGTIIQRFLAYVIREDWPLEERLNILISRLVESNIIEYVFMRDLKLSLRKQKFHQQEKEKEGFTVIKLREMAFAFTILGIGWASATIVFFVEVWKGRKL